MPLPFSYQENMPVIESSWPQAACSKCGRVSLITPGQADKIKRNVKVSCKECSYTDNDLSLLTEIVNRR